MQAHREKREHQDVGGEHERVFVTRQRQAGEQRGEASERERRLAIDAPKRRFDRGCAAGRGQRLAEQAPRPQHQHDRHDDELDRERDLRVAVADAEGLHLADDERGEESAGDRPQAAYHHNHEGVGDRRQIHGKAGGLARHGERATGAGE